MDRLLLAFLSVMLLVSFVPVGEAGRGAITVTGTSYSTGGVFHVEGALKHPHRVHHITVSVPGGNGLATINGSTFSASAKGIVYEPGTYAITIRAYDAAGRFKEVEAAVTVTGVYTVFYDRAVPTSIGAYANQEEIVLPRLYNGSVVIDGLDAASSVAVQQANTAATIPQCLGQGISGPRQECSFSVRPASSPFEIVWLQAPESAITVKIAGYLL